MQTAVRHVSFDLDGTLINSFAVMESAWSEATAQLGITCGFAEYRRYVGLPFPRIIELLGLSNALIELDRLYFDGTRRRADQIAVIDGAADLLDWCRDQGFGTSIITSKPRRNSQLILEKMGLAVDKLICADDISKGKPDPMAARQLCQAFDLAPKDVLYVGDAIFDFQFALNAGLQFLFFTGDGENRLPTNLVNPVQTVDTLAEIKPLLAGA